MYRIYIRSLNIKISTGNFVILNAKARYGMYINICNNTQQINEENNSINQRQIKVWHVYKSIRGY